MLENGDIWHLGNDTGPRVKQYVITIWKWCCSSCLRYALGKADQELSCDRNDVGNCLFFTKFKHTQTHTVPSLNVPHWVNWIGFNTSKGARTATGKTRTVRKKSKLIMYLCVNVFLHFPLLVLFVLCWQHLCMFPWKKTCNITYHFCSNYAEVLSDWFTGVCVCLLLLSVSYFRTQTQEGILRSSCKEL